MNATLNRWSQKRRKTDPCKDSQHTVTRAFPARSLRAVFLSPLQGIDQVFQVFFQEIVYDAK